MQITKNKWNLYLQKEEIIAKLTTDGTISPYLAKILANRGIDTLEKAHQFLQVDKITFSDPNLFTDMEAATQRVKRAIANNEKIVIFGDYDADGITSTTIMMLTLTKLGSTNHSYYIPDRISEGYGPTPQNINKLVQSGLNLLITVDTGIVAYEALEHLQNLNIDCIITDHHQTGTGYPPALAILHPERNDSSACKELSGAGVALQFSYALLGEPLPYIQILGAIGTIADLVPLHKENRTIVHAGLRELRKDTSFGIKSLIKIAGLNIDNCNETDIAFSLVPRLNAAGRLSTADHAVDLLLTNEQDYAFIKATKLEELNDLRKQLVTNITSQATDLADKQKNNQDIIILSDSTWHKGVIGIVASRLVDKLQRPVIICSLEQATNEVTCSGRSITEFNLIENLQKHAHLLTHYGGHSQAVGFSCPLPNLEHLQTALNDTFSTSIEKTNLQKVLNIDLEINISDLNRNFIADLDSLRPYGLGNPEPKLLMQNVSLRKTTTIGHGNTHMRGELYDKLNCINTIAFNMGHLANSISANDNLDVVGTVAINTWNNKSTLQWVLEDINCSNIQIFDFRNKPLTNETIKTFKNLPLILFSQENFKIIPDTVMDNVQLADEYMLSTNSALPEKEQNIVLLDLPNNLEQLVQVLKKQKLSKLYIFFKQHTTTLLSTLPTHKQFKDLYIFFKTYTPIGANNLLTISKKQNISLKTLNWMLAVFIELEFIFKTNNNFIVNDNPTKKQLIDSNLYAQRHTKFTLEEKFLLSDTKQLSENVLNIIAN